MATAGITSWLRTATPQQAALAVTSGVGVAVLFRLALSSFRRTSNAVAISSPRETLLPYLSDSEKSKLGYPPDFYPGARDVVTPFGTMRVYEFGPKEGKKVFFIHGDATPSTVFKPIADALVQKGYRVMLIDIWGRGYTDTPLNAPHDGRLFASQIYFALTSSPIPWTGEGSGGFSFIGFSMGGSIIMDFLARVPNLVNSVILLGNPGLLTKWPLSYGSWAIQYAHHLPSWYSRRVAGDILGTSTVFEGNSPVHWTFKYHNGFVQSFYDTIRYCPIINQHATWEMIFTRMEAARKTDPAQDTVPTLRKIFLVFGEDDIVTPGPPCLEQIPQLPGGMSNVEYGYVPGTHSFPILESEKTIAQIFKFWNL